MMNFEKVKEKKSLLLYILSFLMVLCALFTFLMLSPVNSAYAFELDARNYYFNTFFSECNSYLYTGYIDDLFFTDKKFDEHNPNFGDDNFEFVPGASLYKGDDRYLENSSKFKQLCFKLNLKRYDPLFCDNLSMRFDIYRCESFATSTHLGSIIGSFGTTKFEGKDHEGHIVGVYSGAICDEQFSLAAYKKNFYGSSSETPANKWANWYFNGYEDFNNTCLVSYNELPSNNHPNFIKLDETSTYIVINNIDFSKKYFITVNYSLNGGETSSFSSSPVSVYDIYNTLSSENSFDIHGLSENDSKTLSSLVKSITRTKSKIEYLVQIPGTPFAEKVITELELPIVYNYITVNDAATALGLPAGMKVLNAYAESIDYDERSKIFKVKYAKSFWFKGKNADGVEQNLFLDFNQSFDSFYYGIFDKYFSSEGFASMYWNDIKLKYPQLSRYNSSEVYGAWGFVIIPNTYDLSSAFSKMFEQRSFHSSLTPYQYNMFLSAEQYNKLDANLNYSWLSLMWKKLMADLLDNQKGYEAHLYFFYVNNDDSSQLFIGENGADDFYDNKSAVGNTFEDIGAFIDNSFTNMFGKWAMLALGGIVLSFIVIIIFGSIRSSNISKAAKITLKNASKTRKRKR